jgi:hypothetical protein
VSVSAIGPTGDNRLVTGPTANPATASTPFGGVENETVVTFTNAVNTGQFKICKVSSEPTLQGVTFNFSFSFSVNGVTTTGTAALTPGTCSGLSANIPVVDASDNPIDVQVKEAATPTVAISNISVSNGLELAANTTTGVADFNPYQGFTSVTYTNVRTPPPVGPCVSTC